MSPRARSRRGERRWDAHDAAIEATEEAILNALLAAETMTGRDGIVAHALDAALLAGRDGDRLADETAVRLQHQSRPRLRGG